MAVSSKIITTWHAEHVLRDASRRNDQGTIVIDGTNVDWWSDGRDVWFYEPGKSGTDTIKRYTTRMTVVES